MTKKIMKQRD